MSKIIETDEGRVVRKRWAKPVLIGILALLIIGGGITGAFLFTRRASPAATTAAQLTPDQQQQIAGDSRSESTKVASVTASTQVDNGDSDAAAATLRAAIGQTSDVKEKVSLYKQISSIYTNDNKRDEATAAINDALKIDPNNWTLYKNLGLIDEAYNDIPSAKANFAKADSMLDKSDQNYTPYHNSLQNLINTAGTDQ